MTTLITAAKETTEKGTLLFWPIQLNRMTCRSGRLFRLEAFFMKVAVNYQQFFSKKSNMTLLV